MGAFTDKVVLITGAGSGIGRQLALDLAAEGATIAAVDLRPDGLKSLADALAGKPFASEVADVTDRASLIAAVGRLEQQLGPTDILIANAGIGIETGVAPFRAADFEAQIRVNLIGVANSVEAVLPGMQERRVGHIVGLSSLASYRGLPKMLGYCASKAGVSSLLEGLRVELRGYGIVVTTICPGWIRTPLTTNIDIPQPHMMELPYAARVIVESIRRRRPYIAFPAAAAWQVRVLKWLPAGMSDRLTLAALRRLSKKRWS